ncbi:MAG: AMP-binding protein [Pseudomonadales bacterium]
MAITLNNDSIQHNGNRFARLLDTAEVPVRAVVSVLLPNGREYLDCLRGTTWSGRTFTPINWHLKNPDIAYIVENSEARALVAHANFSEVAQEIAHFIPESARFAVGGDIPGFRRYEEMNDFSADDLARPLAGAFMPYTSGTTGKPKGVKPAAPVDGPPPSYASTMAMQLLSAYIGDNAQQPHLVAAPLYHAAPTAYGDGSALLGADLVIMEQWDPEEFLRLVEAEKICSTFLVPTHFVRLLQLPEAVRHKYDLSSLKLVCHGAAPTSTDVKRRMIDWFGPVLFEFYGGSEGGGISISSQEWLQHPGSVGKPRPDQAIYILDDEGNEVATGEPGNIYFKAPDNRFEYKDDPAKTASVYRGDKYTLGDIGYVDEDAYLYLCDRKADTIISGGVNIYPAEIEGVLLQHGAVKDCCVVGIHDEEWGESVLGAIQLLEGISINDSLRDDIKQHCLQHLAKYQVPRELVFEENLPRTETGKIMRREIRDKYRTQYSQ